MPARFRSHIFNDMQALNIVCMQAPGDILMVTAGVRDLKKAKPELKIGVTTSNSELWLNNPHISKLTDKEKYLTKLVIDYGPYINIANFTPGHFITSINRFLEKQLSMKIPFGEFHGDVHMSSEELESKPISEKPYWLIVCGGKTDFTCKWWNPATAQKVVDGLKHKFNFVQIGSNGTPGVYPEHVHFPLNNVTNLTGSTSIRELIKLVYHAEGVICPVTFLMHLCAAVPRKNNKTRGCVVIAGGREPPHWEAYPGHRFMHTIGKLDCCMTGGCWKRRAQLWPDGQPWNTQDLCEKPVQVRADLTIPKCLDMITADEIINEVESYSHNYLTVLNNKGSYDK